MKTVTTEEAITILQQGGVGILPTDTVYGLVTRAADQAAVERLYGLKNRAHKPGPVIAADIKQLVDLGIKARYLRAVEHLWPNPLSVIIPTGDELYYLHRGLDSIPIRIPKDDVLLSLLEQTGPLLTSSANAPGEAPATTMEEARKYFGSDVDFYVDGGDLSGRLPSTIIRIVDDAYEVLREGALKITETGRIEN
jgi:tRNA threonylcarbamoyl adenosine modification protein (Sua5/YciO/YrdC/YwlC family)